MGITPKSSTKRRNQVHQNRNENPSQKAQEGQNWIDSKAQRAQGGWGLLSQSNPIKSLTNPRTNPTLKRGTEGGRRRGGGLENRRVHEQITKAAPKPNTSEGVFIPAGPVRPVRPVGLQHSLYTISSDGRGSFFETKSSLRCRRLDEDPVRGFGGSAKPG